MTATPTPLGSAPPESPAAPALPLHRFAALESGQLAEIHAVRGRLLLRAGQRLFSLSPGEMHREPALEQVLGEASSGLRFGALSGSYPDGIVADRSIHVPGEPTRVREYVRIAHGRAARIARAHQDVSSSLSESALDLAELPDHRLVARIPWNQGPDPASFLDFAPDAQGPERAQQGFENMKPGGAFMVLRANGATALLTDLYGDAPVLLSWAPRARHAVQTKVARPSGERPSTLIETTSGVLFLITEQALYRQTNDEWKREDLGIKISRAWPYPGGGLLLVSEGAPLLRAADGLGLYHDTAPTEVVDVARLPLRPPAADPRARSKR
jgi:hypothetical protein